ncbi:MAG: LysM peptidoglycan-binding domain-containing protein [Nitrospirae bacterium]|nr:LysM peptidoglycan-binding domain-containing protein [Nitrospirota bacterium]
MKNFFIVFVISLLFCAAYAHAQDASSEEYTVQKSDTLWGISGSKLQDNFLWPKIWSVNPHISNPDLIHPGEKIIIPSKEKLMQETKPLAPEEKKETQAADKPFSKPFNKPVVATEAASKFEFLAEAGKKYIVNKNLYISSGWIADEFPGIGKIVSSPTNRTLLGRGDFVYLEFNKNVGPENKFFTIRDVKIVHHPVTHKKLGHQIRVTGIVEVTGTDNGLPKAKITESFEDIQVSDGLLPYQEMEPPLIPGVVRTPDKKGYVVESFSNTQMSGEGAIVFLDKGRNDGLEAGDVFSTLADVPVERSTGKIQIVSVQPTTSSAIIVTSSEEIIVGARWGQK